MELLIEIRYLCFVHHYAFYRIHLSWTSIYAVWL